MAVVLGGCREISSNILLSWSCWTWFVCFKRDCIPAPCGSPDVLGCAGSQGHLYALAAEMLVAQSSSRCCDTGTMQVHPLLMYPPALVSTFLGQVGKVLPPFRLGVSLSLHKTTIPLIFSSLPPSQILV